MLIQIYASSDSPQTSSSEKLYRISEPVFVSIIHRILTESSSMLRFDEAGFPQLTTEEEIISDLHSKQPHMADFTSGILNG
jgi:hypothetical protein